MLITTQGISNQRKQQKKKNRIWFLLRLYKLHQNKRWLWDSILNLLSTQQDAVSGKTRNAQAYSWLPGSALPLCFHQFLFHLITVGSWCFPRGRDLLLIQCPKELFFKNNSSASWLLYLSGNSSFPKLSFSQSCFPPHLQKNRWNIGGILKNSIYL